MDSLSALYSEQMSEIKTRINLIHSIINKQLSFNNENFDYEMCSLQLRKILELIAFSSLTANKSIYEQVHKNFEKHYKAKFILAELEKLHPNFYPIPMKIENNGENSHHISKIENDNLTKEDFIILYDICSKMLHTHKPFDANDKSINFIHYIIDWITKIQNLLNEHYIQLIDGSYWIIRMNEEDGNVRTYTLSKIENL